VGDALLAMAAGEVREDWDLPSNFLDVLKMAGTLDLFTPQLNPLKVTAISKAITGNSELMPQEHANNKSSEVIFEEWLDMLLRWAFVIFPSKAADSAFHEYLDTIYMPAVAKVWKGKF